MNPIRSKPSAADPPDPWEPNPGMTWANRWLARLSMSFLIVAGALAWQGYRTLSEGAAFWRAALDLFAAAAAVALAVGGVRERHRLRRRERENPET